MDNELTFGGWLKRRRGGLGLTQKELAQQVGYAEITLRKVEADELRPSREMATRLAKALQIPQAEWVVFIRFARDEVLLEDIELTGHGQLGQNSAHFRSRLSVNAGQGKPGRELLASRRGFGAAHVLPQPANSFVGRVRELAELAELLGNPNCRLINLMGPGGVGKTRLALQAAREHLKTFSDGVIYIPLVTLADPVDLGAAIGSALGLGLVQELTAEDQLASYLSASQTLLVLDNFEHLVEKATLVTGLLRHAPQIKVLVTSRSRLYSESEWVFELDGLEVPPPGMVTDAGSQQYSAIDLFVQRARQAWPRLDIGSAERTAIQQICQMVQGNPLAIELAASWIRTLSVLEISQEIERNLTTLRSPARGLPLRHYSLDAVFEQSWKLLSSDERLLFARLSVFRGSFTREAAVQVADASLPTLSALIDKSMLRHVRPGEYEVHELTREFGMIKLQENAELEMIRERHLDYFITKARKELDLLEDTHFHPEFVVNLNDTAPKQREESACSSKDESQCKY